MKKKSWIKRFDKEFPQLYLFQEMDGQFIGTVGDKTGYWVTCDEDMKQFIHQLLQSQREEWKGCLKGFCAQPTYDSGYLDGQYDLRKELKKKVEGLPTIQEPTYIPNVVKETKWISKDLVIQLLEGE